MAAITEMTARVTVKETGTNLGIGLPKQDHRWEMLLSMLSGTSNSQSDVVWSDTRTLAATSEDLDLAGSLPAPLDPSGTVTFAEVTLIAIRNKSTTSTEILSVGGAAANQFINWVGDATDIVKIGANGVLLWTAPVDGAAVTAGTGDKLKIDSGADTITYDILIVGRSA